MKPNGKSELKSKLCNRLIEGGYVKAWDVINHSYTNNRMVIDFTRIQEGENNICPTLTTRPDVMGVVVEDE